MVPTQIRQSRDVGAVDFITIRLKWLLHRKYINSQDGTTKMGNNEVGGEGTDDDGAYKWKGKIEENGQV